MFAGRFKNSIISTGILLSVGTILARVLGLIRDVVIAKHFGVSAQSDIIILILTFPDIVISLLIGTAASIVFVPKFQSINKNRRWQLFTTLSFSILTVSAVISSVLFIGIDYIVHLLAPGLAQKYQEQASVLLGQVVWVIPLLALTYVTKAYLQAGLRFVAIALEGIIYNLVIVLGLVFFTPFVGLFGIVIYMFIGSVARLAAQVVSIMKTKPSTKVERSDSMIDKKMMISYAQAMGGGFFLILLPVIARSFGSYYLGDGFISIFNYSQKIGNLPASITIASLSIIMLPKLSKAMVESNNLKYANELMKKYVTSSFLFLYPMMMSLIWLFVRIKEKKIELFDISAASLDDIYLLSILIFLIIPIQGLSAVCKTIISAKKDMKSFLLINFIGVIIFIPIIVLSLRSWGVAGMGIGLVIIYTLVFIMEVTIIDKKYKILIWNFLFDYRTKWVSAVLSIIYIVVWIVFRNIETTLIFDFLTALFLGGIGLWIAFPEYLKAILLRR